jgi:hypothetical protein
MNNNIEQTIKNLHALINDRLNQDKNLTKDNLFSDALVNIMIDAYYENDLNSDEKLIYSKSELIKAIDKLFQKVEPTKAVAESTELETWLDSAKRISPEIRFECYKKLLIEEKKGNIVEQLEADTFKILDSCHDPRIIEYEWDRRGLVYGHVQSGKTANYIGLINRAFDAGYRIVIVLTGITEDLRKQTQMRIDTGVTGKSEGVTLGIGRNPKFIELDEIVPATSIKLDLTGHDDWRDNNISTTKKSIWVIKKNKTVLENLILWLDKQRKNDGTDKINGVPFLIIDDEADNASIQSISKKEFELWETGIEISNLDFDDLNEEQERKLNEAKEAVIKAINRNIRIALSLMSHKTFVAYTATPYSVISGKTEDLLRVIEIRKRTFQIEQNNDLFPEHFIIPIKAGAKYLGIERIFTTELNKRLPIVVDVTNVPYNDVIEEIFPSKKGFNYNFNEIPNSLEDAIIHFIVTVIIRKFRKQKDYNTLLIHTSHLTKNADYVASKVENYLIKLNDNIITNQGKYLERFQISFNQIKETSKNILFQEYFENGEYPYPETISKNEILNVLNDKITILDVVSYHSSKDDSILHQNHKLSYELKNSETREKKYRNYIVIGGNRLSRGLTLEGLTTSYFVRSSTRQDSLYQMGRWFGYRVGYEDLVRIFIPKDQILWFEGVYKLEMDLRKNFEENNSDDSKIMPRDAIIKLAYHTSETMDLPEDIRKRFPVICDPNKLRNTKIQPMSFSGPTKTSKIIYDKGLQLRNFNKMKIFIETILMNEKSTLHNNNSIPDIVKNSNINFNNVYYQNVIKLLDDYEAHPDIQVDMDSLSNFISENNNELNSWSVVLVQKPANAKVLTEINWAMQFYNKKDVLELQEVTGVLRKWEESETSESETRTISSFLTGRGIDNSFDIIDEQNKDEFIDYIEATRKHRNEKKKPILIIYPAVYLGLIFPLYYFIIPSINGGKKVQYIVRKNRNQ